MELLEPGIGGIELLCQLGDALLQRPLSGTRSLDHLECGGAISPDLTRNLASYIPQGGAEALELRIFVAVILAEIGLARRRELLIDAGYTAATLSGVAPKGAAPDDVIDAIACAEIARRITIGCARPFPDPPEHDAVGLPMAIWA